MSVPQQIWQSTANHSGVELSQNATPTSSTTLESATYAYQEFLLPANYSRGADSDEVRLPDLTGFQFLAQIRSGYAASATADWTFERYDIGSGWQQLAAGTEIGTEADGQVWFGVSFDPIPVLPSQRTSQFRFGVRGRTLTNPVLGQVVEYDDSEGIAVVSGIRVPIKLIPYKATPVTVNSRDGFLTYNPEEDEAVYSDQYGLQSISSTSPNPLAALGGQAFVGAGPITDTSFSFRVLAQSGDSGTDFLGNRYRSVVVRNRADNVSSLDSAQEDRFWLSKPNPSKFAVECLYFDIRDEDGAATVFDQVVADPVTPGAWFSVYYSSEGTPGTTNGEWEGKLWSRVPKAFRMTRRETHVLPEPVTAKFICIEFSHLQAQSYSPGNFTQEVRYAKHPKWVLDYFLLQNQDVTNDPFIARNVQITYDALDLAFNYYTDDLDPSVEYPQPPSEDKVLTFLADRSDASDAVDATTLSQIDTVLAPYLSHPGSQVPLGSLLGETVYDNAQNTATPDYPVESLAAPLRADTRTVSSVRREAVVAEQGFPVMYFYVASRHKYREVEAKFEYDRAYFVGVRELSFTRSHYIAAHDNDLYIETTGDDINTLVNDFRPDPPFRPITAGSSGPNWSFEFPIDLSGSPSAPGWGAYPNDPWPTINSPMQISERTQAFASDGSWSWHLKTPIGNGTTITECDVAAINPDTWTGAGSAFPNGWWPVTAGQDWTWQIDLQPIHNTTGNVWLEIDYFDASGAVVDNNSVSSVSESFQTLTVTRTVPAGAVWASPNIETYPPTGDFIEFYVDNAVWTLSPIALHRFAMIPLTDDASTILTPPAGTPVWSATGLPPGVTLDSSTGLFSGHSTAVADYTGVLTATVGPNSTTRGLTWHVTTAPFLKLAGYLDINFNVSVEPAVAYVHANRCYLHGWFGYGGGWFPGNERKDHSSEPWTNILARPLPLAYRPSVNTAVTLYAVPDSLSSTYEEWDYQAFATEIRTDGTWVFTGPNYPTPSDTIDFLLTDASWPVTPVTNVLSNPTPSSSDDISSLLTVRKGGYWTADRPLTLEQRNDLGGGDASKRNFVNGQVRFHGYQHYWLSESLVNTGTIVDGTWSTPVLANGSYNRQALTNNTGHGAGFDGATFKDSQNSFTNDFILSVHNSLGPSGHAPGHDSKWWGLGYANSSTEALILLHDDSLGASSCLNLYHWQGGSTLTLLDSSPTYAGGGTSPSHTDFWYTMERTGHVVTYSLYLADPTNEASPPTPLVTKSFTLAGAVDTALGPNNTKAAPLYLMYSLAGDSVTTFLGSYSSDDVPVKGYDDHGPIGVYDAGGFNPTNTFPLTYKYNPPTGTSWFDAFPRKGLWFNVPVVGGSSTLPRRVFSANIDGAIQSFEDLKPYNFGHETEGGVLTPYTLNYTPHTDSWFNPNVLATPAPFDDGRHMGKRDDDGYSMHAVDIHSSHFQVRNDWANNTGKAGIIDRYDPVTGAYYAYVYNPVSTTTWQVELWRIDPTAGTPATLIASSSLKNAYQQITGGATGIGFHHTAIDLYLTTWLDTDPATGQRTVHWNATGQDFVNNTPFTISNSSEVGKSSGGVGIDIVQGQVGKAQSSTSNIDFMEVNAELKAWDTTFRGYVADGDVFDFDGLGWVAVTDPTTWQQIRVDTNSNSTEIDYGQVASPSTPVSVSGGQSPYTWTVDQLPAGITMTNGSPNPTFSGTPTAIGRVDSLFTVTDSNGATASVILPWVVNYHNTPADSLIVTIPNGVPYSHQLTYDPVGVGSPIYHADPYDTGTLPPGLTLSSSGLISGTPTTLGAFRSGAVLEGTVGGQPLQNFKIDLQITVT